MRKILMSFAAFCCAATLGSCISDGGDDGQSQEYVSVGDPVPTFTVVDKDDNAFSSTSFYGKKRSLLVFFTTTCSYCRALMPWVDEVWQDVQNTGNPDEYIVIAINRNESDDAVEGYWENEGFAMPYHLDPGAVTFNKFANMSIPRLYMIGSDGKIEWKQIGTQGLSAQALKNKLYQE